MNKSVKILDCTLRDGGYLIDWNFGEKRIQSIVNSLAKSNIDFIECGFLKEFSNDFNKTFFSSANSIKNFFPNSQNYTLMVNFGEYDIRNFSICESKNIKIRVAFKKHQQSEAIEYISLLKKLGWDVFANPMSTNTYSREEILNLISELNKIKPYGVTIVDTLGNMYEDDVVEIFDLINKNLDAEIAIGFHSHNSMQLSFSNAKALLKMGLNRTLIIDSCLYGMGRGAGNLCTELITKYLNDNYNTAYKILPLLKSIDCDLKPIYTESPWGYSTPFYIAAIYGCHPNYASFLVNRNCSDEEIDKVLFSIPPDKKTSYDKNLIEEIAKKTLTSFSIV